MNILGRYDQFDESRNQYFVEDFKIYKNFFDTWTISGGLEKYNWRSLEVMSVTDIVNSISLDSNIEGFDKYGESFISVEKTTDQYKVSAYLFPYLREPYIPGKESRLGVGLDLPDPVFFAEENWKFQYGLKADGYFEWGDLSLFYLNHFDRRSPLFGSDKFIKDPTGFLCGLEACPTNGTLAIPFYFQTNDIGLMITIPWGDFILKGELLKRSFSKKPEIATLIGIQTPEDSTQVGLGIEYVSYFENGAKLRFLGEYNKVLMKNDDVVRQRFTFQNDFYLGLMYNHNDASDHQFNFGMISDIDVDEDVYFLTAQRRLFDDWRVSPSGRYIDVKQQGLYPLGLEIFEDDHQVSFELKYFL